MQGLKIALARRPGLPFLTAWLPSFATRKARRTSSYKIYPPINFTYIDEMMVFLHKSKFPMINIAIIITIANQNCFLLWSDVFIFGTIHYLGEGISLLINCAIPSPVSDSSLSYSPRAHVWGRFGQRNLLVGLGLAFSWVKTRLVILKSSYVARIFLPVPFMKMLISVAPIKYFESDLLKK